MKGGCAVYKPSFHCFVLFCSVSVSLRLIEHYNSGKLIEAFSFLAISQANSSWFYFHLTHPFTQKPFSAWKFDPKYFTESKYLAKLELLRTRQPWSPYSLRRQAFFQNNNFHFVCICHQSKVTLRNLPPLWKSFVGYGLCKGSFKWIEICEATLASSVNTNRQTAIRLLTWDARNKTDKRFLKSLISSFIYLPVEIEIRFLELRE